MGDSDCSGSSSLRAPASAGRDNIDERRATIRMRSGSAACYRQRRSNEGAHLQPKREAPFNSSQARVRRPCDRRAPRRASASSTLRRSWRECGPTQCGASTDCPRRGVRVGVVPTSRKRWRGPRALVADAERDLSRCGRHLTIGGSRTGSRDGEPPRGADQTRIGQRVKSIVLSTPSTFSVVATGGVAASCRPARKTNG